MTLSPTLRAIQAEAAPHMARCGKLTVHTTWHDRVSGWHDRPEFVDVVVPKIRRADADAARAALASLSPFDQAAGLERWIEVACRAAGCAAEELQGFGKGRGNMPNATSAVRAAICEYANRQGWMFKELAVRFGATKSALVSAVAGARQRRQRQEVAAC